MELVFICFTILSGYLLIFFIDMIPEEPAGFLLLHFGLQITILIVQFFIYTGLTKKVVTSRIVKLEEATKKIANGNFGLTVEVKGKDEISGLTKVFNKMSAELKANEYLSKEFTRNVSHEFKTPLSVIRAYGELLDAESNRKTISHAAVQKYAKIIVNQSDRLALLLMSILQLSALDSEGVIKLDETVNPAGQIREIFELTKVRQAEKNLEIDLQLEDISITSNAQLLYLVWQNLITNAIKFSKENGKIAVILKSEDSGLYFEIKDNGVGIKKEDQDKIFNHFFVADSARNAEGSGLGLAIVKKTLLKLGGEIGFESVEGEGSKFFVKIVSNRALVENLLECA